MIEHLLKDVPETKECTLFLGEGHSRPRWEATIELLKAYRPEEITLELDNQSCCFKITESLRLAKQLNEKGLLVACIEENSFPDEETEKQISRFSVMDSAIMYAVAFGLPAYMCDWQPHNPEIHQDILDPCFKPRATRPNLWIRIMAGEENLEVIEGLTQTRNNYALLMDSQARILLNNDDYRAYKSSFFEYPDMPANIDDRCGSSQGMTIRNEYTALCLNSRTPARRVYVAGMNHLEPDYSSSGIPVQKQVSGEHRYVIDCTLPPEEWTCVREEEEEEEEETEPLTLEWESVRRFWDRMGTF